MANKKQVDPKYSPLYAQKEGILKHWTFLITGLSAVLPKGGGKYFIEDSAFAGTSGVLIAEKFRNQKTIRERGITTPVVPLLEEDHTDASYWLSFYQRWDENPNPKLKQLMYNTTSITIYFGSPESLEMIQLFRAEWPGVKIQRAGQFINFVFEAQGAGHPHWQFDAYQARMSQVEAERQRLKDISRSLQETLPEVEDFGDVIVAELTSEEEAKRQICIQKLTQIHFASFASWSVTPWSGDTTETKAHARGPISTTEILNWATSSIIYIQRELSR